MTEPAKQQPLCFDPVIDTSEFRRAQGVRMRAFVDEYVAENGPLDPKRLAVIDAQLDVIDAQLAEAEHES